MRNNEERKEVFKSGYVCVCVRFKETMTVTSIQAEIPSKVKALFSRFILDVHFTLLSGLTGYDAIVCTRETGTMTGKVNDRCPFS